MNQVGCIGEESSLFQCPHNRDEFNNCGQHSDASIACFIGKFFNFMLTMVRLNVANDLRTVVTQFCVCPSLRIIDDACKL